MKSLKTTVIAACAAMTLFSCERPVLLNSEADIVSMTLPEGILMRDPVIENEKISGTANVGTDLTALVPVFTLTEGATIDYVPGTPIDFTRPVKYTVTSEDRIYTKTYTIDVSEYEESYRFEFEDARLAHIEATGKDLPYQELYDGDMKWGTPNYGLYFVKSSQKGLKPTDFPCYQIEDGINGKAAALTTCDTGPLGASFKAPIAAGSLFNGIFKLNVKEQYRSAQFGTPFKKMPTCFKGYFKYKAGAVNKDAKGNVLSYKDKFNIYAVLFETDEELEYLDGSNSKTHENIVMTAVMDPEKCIETDEWTEFNIPFVKKPGKNIDSRKLADGKYSLALVFCSSTGGDYYEGAVGSTLIIDSVEIQYE